MNLAAELALLPPADALNIALRMLGERDQIIIDKEQTIANHQQEITHKEQIISHAFAS